MEMKKHALIMAAGSGRRAGTELPKQFVELLGIPIVWRSVMAFALEDRATEITVVLHPDYAGEFEKGRSKLPAHLRGIKVNTAYGGKERGDSVANGLGNIPDSGDCLVAVHDGARPLVTEAMISSGWIEAAEHGASIPAVPLTDSVRTLTPQGSRHADRSTLVAVQTPQVFKADILHKAFRMHPGPQFTDEASRVEAAGYEVHLTEGDPVNIKVTNPRDFAIAEVLAQPKERPEGIL